MVWVSCMGIGYGALWRYLRCWIWLASILCSLAVVELLETSLGSEIATELGSADSVDLTFRDSFSCLTLVGFALGQVGAWVQVGLVILLLLFNCDKCRSLSREPCFLDSNNGLWPSCLFIKAKCEPTVRFPFCRSDSFFSACFCFSIASPPADDWSGAPPAFLSSSSCCHLYWALQMHTGLRLAGLLLPSFGLAGAICTMTQQQCSRSAFLSLEASESDLEAARMSNDPSSGHWATQRDWLKKRCAVVLVPVHWLYPIHSYTNHSVITCGAVLMGQIPLLARSFHTAEEVVAELNNTQSE